MLMLKTEIYPWHLCRGVYSFRLFVHMFPRLLVLPSRSWNLRQSFRSGFSSPTTHQKAFIFVPWVAWSDYPFHKFWPLGSYPGMGLGVKN